jgi:exopolysaccharide biosynthesis polyprenyl glycosylphosphotransferase
MTRRVFIGLSLALDAVLVNGAFVAAYFLRFTGAPPSFNVGPYLALWPVLTVVYLTSGYVYGLYSPERTQSAWTVGRAAFLAVTVGTITTAAITFFAGPDFFSFSRAVILIAWAVHIVLLVGWRTVALRLTPIRWPEQRVLIVGAGPTAAELAHGIEHRAAWGYRVVGLVTRDGEATAPIPPVHDGFQAVPVLGTVADVPRLVREYGVERVIVASPGSLRELVEELALSDESDVHVEVVPELYEIFIGTVDTVVGDIPLMELTRATTPPWYRPFKRLLDLVGSVTLLLVLSPLLLIAALAILITMGRPVFFVQERCGRHLRPFPCLKFRTMVRDAESGTGPVLATDADPRVTPLGNLLRRFRIDELPQLANILAGQMSFVGPRPERPFFVERYVEGIPGYRERFKVKPGATGLAQVSGGYATTPERKLKYDLIYMYHQDLLMDVQILVETVRVVLTGHGAR